MVKRQRPSSHMTVFWILSIVINLGAGVGFALVSAKGEKPREEVPEEGEGLNNVVQQLRAYHASIFARKADEIRKVFETMHKKRMRKLDQLKTGKGERAVAAVRDGVEADARLAASPEMRMDVLAGKSIPEVYGAARELEERTAVAYQHIRAATLAILREITIDQALPQTAKVETPPSHPLNTPILTRPIYRSADYDVFVKEIRGVERALDTILVSVKTQLLHVERQEELEETGKLSLMVVESSRGGAAMGSGLMPWEVYDTGRPLGTAGVTALPGRKISSAGHKHAEWVFIDTWHIVGPFDNARRDNLNTRFLPETSVDLDATFEGKDGRHLRWQYVSSNKVCVDPPGAVRYAIWYAYAEVFVDQEGDYWIATGGDDFCKLWLNDELVWVSGETPKPYYAFENIQQVHFKRGVNRLLFRIENAGGTVGFSVLLHVQ